MGSLGAAAPMAFGSPSNGNTSTSNGTTHCDPSTTDPSNPACNQNPVFVGPPKMTLPANCPPFLSTEHWVLNFTGGTSTSHGTSNKNGAWGGGTSEGPAALITPDGTTQYAGHLTEWGGGGFNSYPPSQTAPPPNQAEQGFTLNFNGTGPAGSISIHVDNHQTQNNSGTPTASTNNANVTCS